MYQILSRQFITMSEFYLKMSFELTLRLYTKTQIFSLNVMQLKLFLEIGQLITLFNKKFLSVILDNNKQNMYIISWFCGAHYIILIFKSIIIYFKHSFFCKSMKKFLFVIEVFSFSVYLLSKQLFIPLSKLNRKLS